MQAIDLELTNAEVEVRQLEARLRVVPMNDLQLLQALERALSAKRERLERLRARHAPVVHPGHALPGTFAVASGGRALTAYLASLLGYTPEQAFASWRGLRMPDLAVLELAAAPPRVVIPFGALALSPQSEV
jgi:hypothetical protein